MPEMAMCSLSVGALPRQIPGCMDFSFEEEVQAMDDGLNLARVKAGNKVGDVEDKDRVPKGKTSGVYASRSAGVAVRLTKMYYAVAKDGEVTADRVSRFCDQMSFERRSKNLQHGSLVTGYGSWGAPESRPIKLKPLPSTLNEIQA